MHTSSWIPFREITKRNASSRAVSCAWPRMSRWNFIGGCQPRYGYGSRIYFKQLISSVPFPGYPSTIFILYSKWSTPNDWRIGIIRSVAPQWCTFMGISLHSPPLQEKELLQLGCIKGYDAHWLSPFSCWVLICDGGSRWMVGMVRNPMICATSNH